MKQALMDAIPFLKDAPLWALFDEKFMDELQLKPMDNLGPYASFERAFPEGNNRVDKWKYLVKMFSMGYILTEEDWLFVSNFWNDYYPERRSSENVSADNVDLNADSDATVIVGVTSEHGTDDGDSTFPYRPETRRRNHRRIRKSTIDEDTDSSSDYSPKWINTV